MGKGSGRRPTSIEREEFESNWDSIFRREKKNSPDMRKREKKSEKENK